jgi:hypothetical protein
MSLRGAPMTKHEDMLQELRNPEALWARVVQSGYYAVEVDKGNKSKIARQFKVNNRTLYLMKRSQEGMLWRIYLAGYLFWQDIILGSFSKKDNGYLVVEYFSRMFWPRILSYKGEDVDENTIRVTFFPKS